MQFPMGVRCVNTNKTCVASPVVVRRPPRRARFKKRRTLAERAVRPDSANGTSSARHSNQRYHVGRYAQRGTQTFQDQPRKLGSSSSYLFVCHGGQNLAKPEKNSSGNDFVRVRIQTAGRNQSSGSKRAGTPTNRRERRVASWRGHAAAVSLNSPQPRAEQNTPCR